MPDHKRVAGVRNKVGERVTGELNGGSIVDVVALGLAYHAHAGKDLHRIIDVPVDPGDIVILVQVHRRVEAESAGVDAISRGQIVSMGITLIDDVENGGFESDVGR